jgi:hypothetical protein
MTIETKSMKKPHFPFDNRIWHVLVVTAILLSGCKSALELKSVDYSMLLETVVAPDSNGLIYDRGYGLKFNVRPIHFLETGDSTQVNAEYRIIRDFNGYYFITSAGFKNVYIMKPTTNAMKLHKQVLVSQVALVRPAFNQRNPMIQLIDGESRSFMLNKDGLAGGQ